MKRLKVRWWTPQARAIAEHLCGPMTPDEEARGFELDDEAYEWLAATAKQHGVSKNILVSYIFEMRTPACRAIKRSYQRERARRGKP